MNTAVARKRHPSPTPASTGPATTVEVSTPSEIHTVLMDPRRYPSPVRPVGSGSSTTRCVTANGGTQLDLLTMNRVLKIERDRVTVQPGISLTELADILSDEGLELIGGFDLANRTVGGAVAAAGLEASMAGDVGQFASHVLQLKVLSPNGKKFVVSEKTKSLLALMRLSYGLLGVIYEVTLRVRPVQGFAVQTAKVSFKDFGKLGPKLLSATAGVKLYLLPFRDRIYLELRRPAADAEPGRKFAWRLKDWAVYSALPEAARSIGMAVPIRQIRYPLIDSLSEVAQKLVNNALVRSGSNSVEQSGRYRMLGNKNRFTYTTWAFPAGEFANTALAYKLFCKEYYARTGFRCDMPAVGFRLNRDRSALLSPSFDSADVHDQPAIDASRRLGRLRARLRRIRRAAITACRSSIKRATRRRKLVAQRFGTRLAFFNKVRRELDPHDRLVNSFFHAYLPQP